MMKVELTDTEAFLINEVFDRPSYKEDPAGQAIMEVADDCGILAEVGTDNMDALYQSIWEKTK